MCLAVSALELDLGLLIQAFDFHRVNPCGGVTVLQPLGGAEEEANGMG